LPGGRQPGNIVVQRFNNTNIVSTVNYATTNGTALAGVNYSNTSGTLTFGCGGSVQVHFHSADQPPMSPATWPSMWAVQSGPRPVDRAQQYRGHPSGAAAGSEFPHQWSQLPWIRTPSFCSSPWSAPIRGLSQFDGHESADGKLHDQGWHGQGGH
jgi:hypothetical protein